MKTVLFRGKTHQEFIEWVESYSKLSVVRIQQNNRNNFLINGK